jgi:hypothetical protein
VRRLRAPSIVVRRTGTAPRRPSAVARAASRADHRITAGRPANRSQVPVPGREPHDLEQAATTGLINALDRFEPEAGFDFPSFAVRTFNGEVQRHRRDRTSTIRVPRLLRHCRCAFIRPLTRWARGGAGGDAERSRATSGRGPGRGDRGAAGLVRDVPHLSRCAPKEAVTPTPPTARSWPTNSELRTRTGPRGEPKGLPPLPDRLPERECKIVLLSFHGNMPQSRSPSGSAPRRCTSRGCGVDPDTSVPATDRGVSRGIPTSRAERSARPRTAASGGAARSSLPGRRFGGPAELRQPAPGRAVDDTDRRRVRRSASIWGHRAERRRGHGQRNHREYGRRP